MASKKAVKQSSAGQIALTIFLMFVFFPLGILLLIFWIKWGTAEKVVTTILVLIIGLFLWSFVSTAMLVALNPVAKLQEAKVTTCTAQCEGNDDLHCVDKCVESLNNPQY